MTYNKGDSIPLYVEFKFNDEIVNVDTPRVRVLHEIDEKIYEDLPWKVMKPFADGYIYNLDSNTLDVIGEYVAVYEGMYNSEKLNNVEAFELTVPNILEQESIDKIKIYGFVDDLNEHKLLKDVKIKIKNLVDGNIVHQTLSDYSGRWEAYCFAGEFEFEFSLAGYETKILQVQVGDENSEVQFNNISLENQKDKILGSGMFKIEDSFTDKMGLGIKDISINVYSLDDTNKPLLTTTTDSYGKWKAFLDSGSYLIKIKLPSGVEKILSMTIDSEGKASIKETKQSNSKSIQNINTTFGNKCVSDYIKDAHGNGLENVRISVFKNDQNIGETYTDINGYFTLNLDNGVYKIVCSKEKFKEYTFELKV